MSLAGEPESTALKGTVGPAALFVEGGPSGGGFSIKDICDKLIHADRMWKPIEPGVRGAGCELSGTFRGEPWARSGLAFKRFARYVPEVA